MRQRSRKGIIVFMELDDRFKIYQFDLIGPIQQLTDRKNDSGVHILLERIGCVLDIHPPIHGHRLFEDWIQNHGDQHNRRDYGSEMKPLSPPL